MRFGSERRTIADPPRLDYVIEGQFIRDALSLDPDRSRRDQSHLALTEPSRDAGVANDRRWRRVAHHDAGALTAAVLELCEKGRICNAQPRWPFCARSSAHFPHAATGWRKRRRALGSPQRQNCARGNSHGQKVPDRLHQRPFSTKRLTGAYATVVYSTSRGSIGKLVEQNAQSTLMRPSSPTISARSSAGKRRITDRT